MVDGCLVCLAGNPALRAVMILFHQLVEYGTRVPGVGTLVAHYFQHAVISTHLFFCPINLATSIASSVDTLFGINKESKKLIPIARFFLSKTYQNLLKIKLSIP